MLLNKNKLKILGEFVSDYHKRIYGGEVAKKLKMNQKTVSNVLNELEKDNILKFKFEGKNKYYYLNEFYSYLKEVIQMIETQRKINFLEKHEKIKELFLKLEKRSSGLLVVFGSYANFTSNKNSDLDIFTTDKIKDVEDLEELYHIKINIVKADKNKVNKDEHVIKEIIKNHIVLKGGEEFVNLIW